MDTLLYHSKYFSYHQVVQAEARKTALAPESAPKLVGHLVGTVLSYVTITPKGNISGAGVEEILARAAYYLDQNQLEHALKELNSIDGYARLLFSDWEREANNRLAADQVRAYVVKTIH